jgi:uncharacterized protein (DUF1501 family)
MTLNRRSFLKAGLSGLAYFTAEATTPNWIIRSARAMACECLCADRVLLIIQQSGGNDGLNTVIPRTDPVYYDAATRPTIQVPAGMEIGLDSLNGLHPQLTGLADWWQRGRLAVVNNVGYVNPDLSHFTSTDYFEFAHVPGAAKPLQGWVSRFHDSACAGVDPEALEMMAAGMSTVPDSLAGSAFYTPPAVSSAASYQLQTASDRTLRLAGIHTLNNTATIDPNVDFLQRSANVAEASIADIATAAAMPDLVPAGSYPATSFGNGLKLVSQVVRAGFKTRVFYVSQGGYDTHAGQVGATDVTNTGDHAELLGDFDAGINAFLMEMELSGNLDRVLVMSFSEFGRRVKENGSRGTDHGAANCLFVAGGRVNGGVYGGQPDLMNLIKGNLKHTVDFRSVYAQVIEGWFLAGAAPVFGQAAYDSVIRPELPEIPFVNGATAARGWEAYA